MKEHLLCGVWAENRSGAAAKSLNSRSEDPSSLKKKKKLNKKKEKEVIQFFLVDMQFDFKSDV